MHPVCRYLTRCRQACSVTNRIFLKSAIEDFRDLLKQAQSANDETGFLQRQSILISARNEVSLLELFELNSDPDSSQRAEKERTFARTRKETREAELKKIRTDRVEA